MHMIKTISCTSPSAASATHNCNLTAVKLLSNDLGTDARPCLHRMGQGPQGQQRSAMATLNICSEVCCCLDQNKNLALLPRSASLLQGHGLSSGNGLSQLHSSMLDQHLIGILAVGSLHKKAPSRHQHSAIDDHMRLQRCAQLLQDCYMLRGWRAVASRLAAAMSFAHRSGALPRLGTVTWYTPWQQASGAEIFGAQNARQCTVPS